MHVTSHIYRANRPDTQGQYSMAKPANTALISMADLPILERKKCANEARISFGASETTCFHGGNLLPKAGALICIDCQVEFVIGLGI